MVRMGNVWDRTTEVLGGRGGMLAGIAILTLFVPPAINAGYVAYAGPGATRGIVAALVVIAVTLAALWGQLWIIAASTDPATDRTAARRQADARLLPALLVAILFGLAFVVLLLPAGLLLVAAGFDFTAIANGAAPAPATHGPVLLAVLYILVLMVAVLFVGARLLPIYAVVLHERTGLASIARSWRLTCRHTWRIVGVLLLFMVVLLVASWAAQSVTGIVARLALGGDAQATVGFVAALGGQAASTALTLVAVVFSAQLYVALLAREQRLCDRATQAGA